MLKDIIINIFIASLIFLTYSCSGSYKKSNDISDTLTNITDNWQYRFGKSPVDSTGKLSWLNDNYRSNDWKNIKVLEEIPRDEPGKTLWLRTILPDTTINNPAIFIEDLQQVMQVYIEDSLIYQFGVFDQNNTEINMVHAAHLIPLPKNFQDKFINIRIYSSIKNIGFYRFPLIGESFSITKHLFLQNLDDIIFSSLYILIGGTILFSLLFIKVNKMFLGLSLFLLSLGLWIVSNSQFLQLYFPSPYFYYFLDNISIFSFAIGPFYIAEQIIDNKYKKVVRWLWQVNILYLVTSLAVEFWPGYNFSMIFDYYLAFFFIINIIGLIVMILSASKGNFQTRFIIIGFVICAIFGLLELVIYSEGIGAYSPVLIHIGSFTLVIMLSLTLFYEFKITRNQKDLAQQKALEAINREKETRKQFTQRLITAQEDERKRISFELHDAVGQDLLVIKNMARLVQKNKNDLDAVEDFLNDISVAAENSIKDIRDLSRTLHPYQLNKLGLTAALKSLVAKVKNSTELNVDSDISNIDKLFDQSKEIHIFRVLQECLNNIIKHSEAKNVEVKIINNLSEILLEIKDDGRGFEIKNNEDSSSYGIGITGINERVQILNGTLDIQSQLNIGTCIKVFIPVKKIDDINILSSN